MPENARFYYDAAVNWPSHDWKSVIAQLFSEAPSRWVQIHLSLVLLLSSFTCHNVSRPDNRAETSCCSDRPVFTATNRSPFKLTSWRSWSNQNHVLANIQLSWIKVHPQAALHATSEKEVAYLINPRVITACVLSTAWHLVSHIICKLGAH